MPSAPSLPEPSAVDVHRAMNMNGGSVSAWCRQQLGTSTRPNRQLHTDPMGEIGLRPSASGTAKRPQSG